MYKLLTKEYFITNLETCRKVIFPCSFIFCKDTDTYGLCDELVKNLIFSYPEIISCITKNTPISEESILINEVRGRHTSLSRIRANKCAEIIELQYSKLFIQLEHDFVFSFSLDWNLKALEFAFDASNADLMMHLTTAYNPGERVTVDHAESICRELGYRSLPNVNYGIFDEDFPTPRSLIGVCDEGFLNMNTLTRIGKCLRILYPTIPLTRFRIIGTEQTFGNVINERIAAIEAECPDAIMLITANDVNGLPAYDGYAYIPLWRVDKTGNGSLRVTPVNIEYHRVPITTYLAHTPTKCIRDEQMQVALETVFKR